MSYTLHSGGVLLQCKGTIKTLLTTGVLHKCHLETFTRAQVLYWPCANTGVCPLCPQAPHYAQFPISDF